MQKWWSLLSSQDCPHFPESISLPNRIFNFDFIIILIRIVLVMESVHSNKTLNKTNSMFSMKSGCKAHFSNFE